MPPGPPSCPDRPGPVERSRPRARTVEATPARSASQRRAYETTRREKRAVDQRLRRANRRNRGAPQQAPPPPPPADPPTDPVTSRRAPQARAGATAPPTPQLPAPGPPSTPLPPPPPRQPTHRQQTDRRGRKRKRPVASVEDDGEGAREGGEDARRDRPFDAVDEQSSDEGEPFVPLQPPGRAGLEGREGARGDELRSIQSDLEGASSEPGRVSSDDEDGPLGAVTRRLRTGRAAAGGTTAGPALSVVGYEEEARAELDIEEEDLAHALAPARTATGQNRPTGLPAGRSSSPRRSAQAGPSVQFSFAADDTPAPRVGATPAVRACGREAQDRNGLNDGEEDDEESSLAGAARPTTFVREKVLDSLRFDGCNCSQQTGSRDPRKRSTGYTMSQLADRWRVLYGVPDILSIVALHGRLPNFPPHVISSTDWKALLAGVERSNEDPVSLSLDRSDVSATDPPVAVRRTWDIDAIIIPITSLGAHRNGLETMFYPRFTKTITSPWHTPVTPRNIVPRECKHMRIGRGTGVAEFDTYIFFYNLPLTPVKTGGAQRTGPDVYRRRCYLTQKEQRTWIDDIFYPALLEIYADDIRQHIPRSFDEAVDRSQARQRETISSGDRSTSELPYHLTNDTGSGRPQLARLWEAILDRIPIGSPYADPELVVVTYNCKLQYRRPHFNRLRTSVDQSLRDRFDRSYLNMDHAYVDLAYEDIAEDSETGQPHVLLRRTGCNLADLDSLGLGQAAQSFSWFGTTDASSARATPSKKSALRSGGLAYVQEYNVVKDIFASPDRSTGPLFSDAALPFLTYTRKTFLDLQRIAQDPRSYSLAHVDRIRNAFKATIAHLDQVLRTNTSSSNGFSTRQEYRIAWNLFMTLEIPDRQPVLPTPGGPDEGGGPHWPFYVLPKADALQFVRWQLNRWLYAICAVISIPSPVDLAGQPPTPLHKQQLYTATSSALFSCLQVIANSEYIGLLSRIARTTYYKPAAAVSTEDVSVKELWRVQNPPSLETVAGNGEDDPSLPPVRRRRNSPPRRRIRTARTGVETTGEPIPRRGLGLLDSLRRTNMVWLPVDMFSWDRLCFIEEILVETAFVTPRFRALYQSRLSTDQDECVRRVANRSLAGLTASMFATENANNLSEETLDRLNRAGWTLWNVCIFGFSHEILRRLTRDRSNRTDSSKLPAFWSSDLTDAERQGFHGLSYGLIHRGTGRRPVISPSRSSGGRSAPGGFSGFPNTWEARIGLLFDFDDGFKRKNWESSRWRLWFRYCYEQLEAAAGPEFAQRWRKRFPAYASNKLTILPRYEADKLFQFEKITSNISVELQSRREVSRSLKWSAAVPVFGPSTGQAEAQRRPARWQMIVQEGTYQTPNPLEHLFHTQRELVTGQRLRHIDGLIGTSEQQTDDDGPGAVIEVSDG